MDEISEFDGSIVSSSQHLIEEWNTDRRMPPLLGIIMSVYPADQKNNFTAQQSSDLRGIRHECTVLATDYLGKQPDILIPHVTIPPMRHSGVDNFEEDLPRGCSNTVDESTYNTGLSKVDYAKLDGEWCMVGFVGGAFECPFIMGWWHHPSNRYDLATSASGYKGKALKQVDVDKNKFRFIRRINGTFFLVNQHGSVYLDTTESNSTVSIANSKVKRELIAKGGHVQVDVESSAQLEINFNEKEHKNPRLGAGSTSSKQVTDEALPHPDQPVSGSPKKRSTVRTFRRSKEWETLEKTSNYNLFCENTESETNGKKGEAAILAEDTVSITVSKSGGKGTMINIVKGKIQVWSDDGTQVNVLNDEVQIATKSGGLIDVKGSSVIIAGKVDVSGPMAVGGEAGQPTLLGTSYSTLMKTYYMAEAQFATGLATAFTELATLFAAIAILPPAAKLAAQFTQLATASTDFADAATAANAGMPKMMTLNFTSS